MFNRIFIVFIRIKRLVEYASFSRTLHRDCFASTIILSFHPIFNISSVCVIFNWLFPVSVRFMGLYAQALVAVLQMGQLV